MHSVHKGTSWAKSLPFSLRQELFIGRFFPCRGASTCRVWKRPQVLGDDAKLMIYAAKHYTGEEEEPDTTHMKSIIH